MDYKLEEMRAYIKKKKWSLVEAIFDYIGSCEGLFNLSENLKTIDIILIYDRSNISDEFNLEFLYQIALSENVEIKEFRLCNDI
ncbi:MAG: hypothetical protein LKH79_06845 [Heyndrickxia oleronia]|nr:hypothetical protein [Heyndrickxia oleronia]MCI1590257.1 hypothetical protein [Heyndrickxia oleronia]MCI1614039.1 hypothetical protein [Heyndrickxia oleronia]